MKHLLRPVLFSLFAIFTLSSFAQRADTIVSKTWENGVWVNETKLTMAYNADCNLDNMLMQMWSDNWQNTMLTWYSYKSGSYVDTARSQMWTGNKWQDYMRVTYTYTADFKVDIMLVELNIIKWTNSSRVMYSYNANGNVATETHQTYVGNKWINNMLITFTYNADQTVQSILIQQWIANAWVNLSNTTSTYNADKTVNTSLTQQWQNNAWVNQSLQTNTYSGGKQVSEITQQWVNNAWEYSEKTEYTYNASGEMATITESEWNGTDWTNTHQTTFSYTTSCTLPLTLLDFNLSKSNESVLLKWQTSNEINTKGFNVQRSKDGIHFSDVGFVPSQGGAKLNEYRFTDAITADMNGKQYYRLQMLDNDGKYTMSKSLFVSIDNNGSIVIYPNPVKDRLIFVTDKNLNDLNVKITDQNGRVLINTNMKAVTAGQQNTLDVSRLSKGLFVIQLTGPGYTKSSKFIKF